MLKELVQKARRPPARSFASTIRHLGALGLFFLAILDSSPIPTFGGPDILTAVLSASHRNPWWEYAATATAGSVIGAYITFPALRPKGRIGLPRQQIQKRQSVKVPEAFQEVGQPGNSLAASSAIPIPTPTSMFFAAAGASDYPIGKFIVVVAISRAVRYSAIAFVADPYGRRFIRALRHPSQYWGWMVLVIALTVGLIVGGILINRRLDPAPAE